MKIISNLINCYADLTFFLLQNNKNLIKDINFLWFKKDLRLVEDEALYESLKDNEILPIYIFEIDDWNYKTHSNRQ